MLIARRQVEFNGNGGRLVRVKLVLSGGDLLGSLACVDFVQI